MTMLDPNIERTQEPNGPASFPVPPIFEGDVPTDENYLDQRFRKLLGEANWLRLPKPVRMRFGKAFGVGQSVIYQGIITRMNMNWPGFMLAHLVRLVGAPLPYDRNSVDQPAVVVVTEDTATNGQFWIRQYGRKNGFPQTVHSSKRFAGPTGLEEYIGYCVGMALKVEATNTALLFKSDHYFLQLFGKRFRLPAFLTPGALTIGHHELGEGRFAFTLLLKSKLFGTLIEQDAVFTDAQKV